jgi:AhpD family alkylhydroperoxidase
MVETMATMAQEDAELRESIPAVYDAIWALQRAAIENESTLDSKTRALISFAIGVSKQDEGCIAAVGMALAKLGATVEEVADAMGVVILMNGGPGHVWATHALAAFKECAAAA